MNKIIETMKDHKTIRDFKDRPVEKEVFDTIIDVMMRTATSTGLQRASIIRVTDQDKKDKISKVCKQDYVARAPELLIFIVDLYRNDRIIKDSGEDIQVDSNVDTFFQGFTDGVLMAQNATNAIEALGLGAVYLGSILNDAKEIIEILDLPKLTFPILGLAFGYKDQEPQLKPRMDKDLRVFENSYKIFDDYKETFKEYDKEMESYYDLRNADKPLDKFSLQVIDRQKNILETRQKLLDFARENGFKL